MFVSQQFSDRNFYQLVRSCKENLRMVLPNVQTESTQQILKFKQDGVNVELLTGYEINDFFFQKTDLKALRSYVDHNCSVFGVSGLQGSFCLFDEQKALINTGPITRDGFGADKNYGVIVNNRQAIHSLLEGYDALKKQSKAKEIDANRLNEMEKALAKLTGETEEWVWDAERNIEELGLSPWALEIFNCVLRLPGKEFTLKEMYEFESILAPKFPANQHIKPKIRQQLQVLRDKNLIEFLGRGHYRKLSGLSGL